MDVVRIPGSPGRPHGEPIGMLAARVGKVVDRSFDEALGAAGGTRPTWLVLLAVKSGAGATQSAIAARIGISGATLIHHLDRLEAAALIVRARDPADRRNQAIVLTPAGEELFVRLRDAAVGFDRRLRACLGEAEVTELHRLLTALLAGATDSAPTPPGGRPRPRK